MSATSGSLSSSESWTLLALSAACAGIIWNAFRSGGEPLVASLGFSGIAFAFAFSLIRWLSPTFLKKNIKGVDMSKHAKHEMYVLLVGNLAGAWLTCLPSPESMGAVCAIVYILLLLLFIPFPFYKDFVAATSGGGNKDVVFEILQVETGRLLHKFPHYKLTSFLSALLSLQSVVILGIGDDLFDIRWRHKFFIPMFAAIPILAVYFVDFGVTHIVVPKPIQELGYGELFDLGWLYYAYMAALAIFCPNCINIVAGINGIEVSQSIVIAVLLLINDFIYLSPFTPYPHPATDSHLLSIYMLLPFLGVSLALWWHNWYPAKVFVGDTYCYFAGMIFAIVAILGHFSKTLLLLLIPQIFNFLYSVPQLFKLIPCPRHRLPRFNGRTGLLEPSVTEWQRPPKPIVATALKLLSQFRLIKLTLGKDGQILESSNLTILNLWLVWFGPMREDKLAQGILAMQFAVGIGGLLVRHQLAGLLFWHDNF